MYFSLGFDLDTLLSRTSQDERAAIPPALARDMLGIPACEPGSVVDGAHTVARTFLGGLAAEVRTSIPPTAGGNDRVKEFVERFFGMDIEAALAKITELNHEAFAQGLRDVPWTSVPSTDTRASLNVF